MACSACSKIKNISPVESGLPFIVNGNRLYVSGKDGKKYPIQGSLVVTTMEPRGGWFVDFKINGQSHHFSEVSPQATYNEVRRLLDLNEVFYTTLNLWFNLNLQWLSRAVDKYQKVTYASLAELSTPNPNYNE
jgi:hypothetical protein